MTAGASPQGAAQVPFLQMRVGNQAMQRLVQSRSAPSPSAPGAPNGGEPSSVAAIHSTAARGVASPAGPLPFLDAIAGAFGDHDLSGIRAHTGAHAASAAADLRAAAYTSGEHIVFGQSPDLATAAHEAAHVLQQRAGLSPPGGVGARGDIYERHADAVAARVAAGQSAADLLDALPRESVGAVRSVIQRLPVNGAFQELTEHEPLVLNRANYMGFLGTSIEENRPIAYIVNAILPYTEVEQIPQVIASVLRGLQGGLAARVGFVFGVNAREDRSHQLDAALVRAAAIIEELDVPIAIVRSTFTGAFPFGVMRNNVMHSQENRDLIAGFAAQGMHPYLSVQDFDTGSRLTGSGEHIFNYFDNQLNFNAEDFGPALDDASQLADDDETLPASRPLLMTGGYRPGAQADLARETQARLEKLMQKPEEERDFSDEQGQGFLDTLTMPDKQSQFFMEFQQEVDDDMRSREILSRVHPLLPYAPEPNLFLDALPILMQADIRFGEGAAEFTNLGKDVNRFLAFELEQYYQNRYESAAQSQDAPRIKPYRFQFSEEHPIDLESVDLESSFFESPSEDLSPPGKEEILEQLKIAAQTGRHPLRGIAFLTDFMSGQIETDLSRLALGKLTSGGKLQSHAQLTHVVDRFFDSKKAKTGARFASFRDSFRDFSFERREPLRPLESAPYEDFEEEIPPVDDPRGLLKKDLDLFGKNKSNLMSSAISTPFSGPFEGLSVGLQPSEKGFAGFSASLSNPRDQFFRLLSFLKFSMGGTPLDGNCLYHAVNQARGFGDSLDAARGLRAIVVEWAMSPDHLGAVVDYAHGHGVDFGVLINTLQRNGNWQGPAGDLAPRMVASALGRNIEIHRQYQLPLIAQPLAGPAGGDPIVVYLHNSHYSIEQPW